MDSATFSSRSNRAAGPRSNRPAPLALDEAQSRVRAHRAGPLLVLGSPGTGKTTVIEERFAGLVAGSCTPDRILVLVNDRDHKMGLRDRLTRRLLMDEGMAALIEVPVYTWYGLAHHLVSRHYRDLGYPEAPVLLTGPEQWGDVRDTLASENELNWPSFRGLLRSEGFVDEIVDFCIRAEQQLLAESDLRALVERRPEYAEVIEFYRKRRRRLQSSSRIDYPRLLEDAGWLLANVEPIRQSLENRFAHVLVDDAHELAPVQQRLLSFLTSDLTSGETQDDRSLVVAADPDSCIETFRGADPAWLGDFSGQFGAHETVVLGTSYRLGEDLGNRSRRVAEMMGDAPHRAGKFCGEATLEAASYPSLAQELEGVARTLRQAHLRDGVAYDDMAVLLSSPHGMLAPLERALQTVEVPYSVSIPDRSLEREPSVAAFRCLARYALEDDAEALDDLVRSPLVGFEEAVVRDLDRAAFVRKISLGELLDDLPGDVTESVRARIASLLQLRDVLRSRRDAPADQAFWAVWESATFYRDLELRAQHDPDASAHRDLDALVAFARALGRFIERRRGSGTLMDYLGAIGRADFGADPWLPRDRKRRGVEILSFHRSKGKQWSVVCVSGCVEGSIPKGRRARGMFDVLGAQGPQATNDAEDRRVFYVALTRAKKRCVVTTSPGPTRRGRPSRYLGEIMDSVPEAVLTGAEPLTFTEAAGSLRRTLADLSASASERVAALGALARVRELDPSCAAADPREWWWRWDWTEGAIEVGTRRVGVKEGSAAEGSAAEGSAEEGSAEEGSAEEEGSPKLRTSYSRISQYDNCPLAYLFSVVLGLDPDTSHNMAFGTWIHQIFEDCEKPPSPEEQVRGRRRLHNKEAALARFEELFDPQVFPNRAIARQFHRDGGVMIERYCAHLSPGTSLLAEHGFTIDHDGHTIRGRIDRVDRKGQGIVVADYKTSRSPISTYDVPDSLQLAIYYLAAARDPELVALGEPVSMQLVYPASMSRGDVTRRCQTPEQAQAVLERLPGLLEGVVGEDFEPSPEANCRWCKFKPLCPLWPEGREAAS
ncbi:MAG: ATP-dependent helicase [Actinobacteria bacterium]|nr:ATP-dependent helicase [Actinomycetota bacterium]